MKILFFFGTRPEAIKLAPVISEEVGFMRVTNRHRVGFIPKDNSWGSDPCDNGVVAQWYADQKKMGSKLSLAISSWLGKTPKMGIYGMVIDDLVYHNVFGFGEDWISDMKNVLGNEYLSLRSNIISKGLLTDDDIKELIRQSKRCATPRLIDGKNISDEMNKYIETLKTVENQV